MEIRPYGENGEPCQGEFLFDFGSPTPTSATSSSPASKAAGASRSTTSRSCWRRLQADRQTAHPPRPTSASKQARDQKLETERFVRQHGITRYKPHPFLPGQHS